jgi:hypothetical protein
MLISRRTACPHIGDSSIRRCRACIARSCSSALMERAVASSTALSSRPSSRARWIAIHCPNGSEPIGGAVQQRAAIEPQHVLYAAETGVA